MANPSPPETATPDSGLGDVRHGYAPDARHEGPVQPDLGEIAASLLADLRATAASEALLLQARATLAGDGLRRAAIWGGVAGAAAVVALLAFCVGMILVLVPHVGPLLATVIIVVLLLAIVAIGGWRARGGVTDIRIAFGVDRHDIHPDDIS